MRTPLRWSVAIRQPSGAIYRESRQIVPRWPGLRAPIVRGLAAIADALTIGVQALRIAVRETTGAEPTAEQTRSTLGLVAVGIIAVFVVAPGVVVTGLEDLVADVLEAAGRASGLVFYLAIVARSPQARRLFAYHGAEHKVVAAYERVGRVPTFDEARAASPIHPRCGSSFLALFVVVAGVVYSLVPRGPIWADAAWRLALAPIAVGVAFELMRAAAARPRSLLARAISAPGRAVQRVTTCEPGTDELDVALAALTKLVT